jgi:hypothetical protein
MKIRILRDFFTVPANYSAGQVIETDQTLGLNWVSLGLASEVKPVAILLETKPQIQPQTEVKKRGRSSKHKRSETASQG